MQSDIAIIGGGIVGLATAQALVAGEAAPSVLLLEKERTLARHQSSHNSGVLHAGLQYTPGSAKARLAREGIRTMTEFCRHHDVPHEICGKLVVAVDESELPRLDEVLEGGRANGLQGLRRLGPEEAAEIEPKVRCVAAIQVPEEGIVSFEGVCAVLEGEIISRGVDVRTGAAVVRCVREGDRWRLITRAGEFLAKVLVNCAGLHSDRVARMAGERPQGRVIPFRGEYRRLSPEREHLIRHLVYPLPDPRFPFLGVHFTRRITGGIDVGPNAVLAFAREGYRLSTVNPRDVVDALRFPGLWRFALRHRGTVAGALGQSMDRRRFLAAVRRLVPGITAADLTTGGAGVRAQVVLPSGEFVHDFLWIEREGAVHVLNAPSPAATASLAIGLEVARRAGAMLGSPVPDPQA